MSDFLFANPVKTPRVNPLDQFDLSEDEISRIELIGNTLASDYAKTVSVNITVEENGLYLIQIVPSCFAVAIDLHNIVQQHVDGKATINPDRNLVKLHLVKKVYAQFLVQWLHDYKVNISEFFYPIDDFII